MIKQRLTKNKKPKLLIVADTETYTKRHGSTNPRDWEVVPYAIGWYEMPSSFNYKCTNIITQQEFDKICEDVEISWDASGRHEDYFKDRLSPRSLRNNLTLWFHNADYDIRALLPHYLLTDKAGNIKSFKNKSTLIWKTQDNGKLLSFLYRRQTCTNGIIYNKLEFNVGCTWKFFRKALKESVPKLFKDIKTEIDYSKWDKVEIDRFKRTLVYLDNKGESKTICLFKEEEYLRRDVALGVLAFIEMNNYKILVKAILRSIGVDLRLWEEKAIDKTQTLASLGKAAANAATKGEFSKLFRWKVTDKLDYARQHACSCGGYTSYNKNISVFECKGKYADWEIVALDVNSMYPGIMYEELPIGPTSMYPFVNEPYFTWYIVKMTRCTWAPNYDYMQQLIFSNEAIKNGERNNYEYYLTPAYYELIKKYGDSDAEIVCEVYQAYKPVLKDFMNKMYSERKKYKKGDPQYELIKLIINSLYGKFCERSYVIDYKYQLTNLDDEGECPWRLEKVESLNANPIESVLTGVYVIQKGRVQLLQAMVDEFDAGNIVLYVDTDSLKIAKPKGVKTQTELKGLCDENKLGMWKHEGTYDLYLCPNKAKKYFMCKTEEFNKYFGTNDPKFKDSFTAALSGIVRAKQEELKELCTLEDWKRLMSVEHNVFIKDGDKKATQTYRFKQTVIRTGPFKFQYNSTLKRPSWLLSIENGKIVWEPIDPNEVI